MGSQNSKLYLESMNNPKADNPFLNMNQNGPHLSQGSTILKPNFHTNANCPTYSASTQDNVSKRNSSYAESSNILSSIKIKNLQTSIKIRYYKYNLQMAFPCTKSFYNRKFYKLEELHSNEKSRSRIRDSPSKECFYLSLLEKKNSNCLLDFTNINLLSMGSGNILQKTKLILILITT